MNRPIAIVIAVLVIAAGLQAGSANQRPRKDSEWQTTFAVEKSDLASTGSNPYFSLAPGAQSTFEGGDERLVITVLNQTRQVDGVETRVIEERETKRGKLVEVSRNYFAISRKDRSVYYFGEAVDMYEGGRVVSHEGAWESGLNGARFGLMMPSAIRAGLRFYQEIAPKVAMDRAEIVSLNETVKTPAGTFTHCVKVEETTPLEPGVKEYKYYARGVGLVQDSSLKLVQRGTDNP